MKKEKKKKKKKEREAGRGAKKGQPGEGRAPMRACKAKDAIASPVGFFLLLLSRKIKRKKKLELLLLLLLPCARDPHSKSQLLTTW